MRTVMWFLVFSLAAPIASAQSERIFTKVFLNGMPAAVYFNDGDTFKVMNTRLRGTKARLGGFNTLESYGPVHQIGGWTMEEMERFAALGTKNARQGEWHCTTKGESGGYGRLLYHCPDLVVSQLRKGYAHTMTVTLDPVRKEYIAAQAEAIKHRRGIWAHGVPEFVISSLHSNNESRKMAYNRMLSVADGHSEPWKHTNVYAECQRVCQPADDVDDAKVAAFLVDLRETAGVGDGLAGYTDDALAELVKTFVTEGYIKAELRDDSKRFVIEQAISRASAAGRLTTSGRPVTCMLYVPFKRRYGSAKAVCLQ